MASITASEVIFQTNTKIVGVTRENRQSLIESLDECDEIELVREENNPYDENAIAVLNSYGEKLGYIRSELAERIVHYIEEYPDTVLLGNILEITGGTDGKSYGCNIEVILAMMHQINVPGPDQALKQRTEFSAMKERESREVMKKISSLKTSAIVFYIIGVVGLITGILAFDLAWPIGVFILLLSIIPFLIGHHYSALANNARKYLESRRNDDKD